jgi:hypothetical protein
MKMSQEEITIRWLSERAQQVSEVLDLKIKDYF